MEKLLACSFSHTLLFDQAWRMDLVQRMDSVLVIESPLTSSSFSSQLLEGKKMFYQLISVQSCLSMSDTSQFMYRITGSALQENYSSCCINIQVRHGNTGQPVAHSVGKEKMLSSYVCMYINTEWTGIYLHEYRLMPSQPAFLPFKN